ncbi:zinc finger protein Xfin [Osmerus mordax]|uniref:zinc finger protein Xfin n=1 Tax=Osmerus mordax TaxID=8014 RepID=UPI00350EFE7A
MLGLQGNTTTSKVYSCMACSATFTGLRSLLVHQASHVNDLHQDKHLGSSKPSSSAQIGSMDESNKKHCITPTLESPACTHFICDCGCEFKDFNLMMEHKKTHVSKTEMQPGKATAAVCADGDCCEPPLLQPTLNKSAFSSLTSPPSSIMSSSNFPTIVSGFPTTEVDSGRLILLTIPSEDISPPNPTEHGQSLSFVEPSSQAIQSPVEVNHSVTRKNDCIPKNKSIMKMLATAYMKRFQTPQPSSKHCKRNVIPKTETIPLEITSKSKLSATPGSSIDQLRRLLLKSSTKTKASVFRNSCSENIVVPTKSYCPVVVLETRQKLIDFSNMSAQGSYQCGRCRRVFKDCDSLTVHHATHRKEKVKCCRLCKQLIIGKSSLPDNHTCPMLLDKALFHSAKSKLPFIKRTSSFHHQKTYHFKQQRAFLHSNTRKPFYCQFCKHSYTRRYSLKTHKCLGSQLSHHASVPPLAKDTALGTNNETRHIVDIKERPQSPTSVAVGTDTFQHIKGEVITMEVESGAQLPGLAWTGCPRSFSPFSPKHPTKNIASVEMGASADDWVANQFKTDQREGSDDAEKAGCSGQEEDGQWTIPLDDETEVLIEAEDAAISDVEQQEPMSSDMSVSPKNQMPFFIKDGVKRYPCNNCLKTYSRGTTLRKHQKICGSLRSYVLQGEFGSVHQKVKGKPMHDCFVCGKSFNRRDNMMAHRRKCQLRRTVGGMDNRQHNFSASKSLSLLGAKSEASDPNQGDNGSNWGIMSLPSVLPRRVTCECGAGFTSPQLLLEHLQKHAQESYTCPTCGETLGSWADYEVHLQVHMQPHNQLYHGVQLQRAQPLLLRFQQHPHQRPSKQPALKKQPFSEQCQSMQLPGNQLSLSKSKQRCICIRCNNTFSTRSSLIKHLSLNRCKGIQGSVAVRTNHCSRCNVDFPNVLSLKFHQRSGGCKTAFKPMRCPVCVRWFGTVEGLQKHLLTHNQSDSFSCLVCQRVYSSLKSLKDHSRKVHKIRAGDIVPVTQVTI